MTSLRKKLAFVPRAYYSTGSVASVRNVVQNIDGTISRLPVLMSVDTDGWWLTDGSIYWRANTTPKSKLAKERVKGK